jgi:hypothetical protein
MTHKILVRAQFANISTTDCFAKLSDHAGFLRLPGVRCALMKKGSPDPNGLGAIRCVRGLGLRLTEEIVEFDAPMSYSYRIRSIHWLGFPLPIQHKLGSINLLGQGKGVEVVWESEFSARSAWLERKLGRLFAGLFMKLLTRALVEPAI